jgi:hypothetical protein
VSGYGNLLRLPCIQALLNIATNRTTGRIHQEKTESSASRVWLESDEEFVKEVIGEYTWMKTHEFYEAEFATYGKEVLIRRESRHRSRVIGDCPSS